MLIKKMLHPLLVHFNFYLVLLLQVLPFPFFVTQLRLLIFKLLLLDDPKVVEFLLTFDAK